MEVCTMSENSTPTVESVLDLARAWIGFAHFQDHETTSAVGHNRPLHATLAREHEASCVYAVPLPGLPECEEMGRDSLFGTLTEEERGILTSEA